MEKAKTAHIRPRTAIVKSEQPHGVEENNGSTDGQVAAWDAGEEKKHGSVHEVVEAGLEVGTNTNPTAVNERGDSQYLTGPRLVLVFIGIMLSVLLTALDQSIVSTAIPKLSSEFNSLDRLTWIVSAYFLPQAALILFFGQVLTIASSKWVSIFCITVFEIGSLICGVAPNMDVLILGRAIQGVGSGGGYVTILAIIAQVARLEVRPMLLALCAAVYGLSTVFGPLLGGIFTDKLTWRWCFYINLPFGAISLLAVLILLPKQPGQEGDTSRGPENVSVYQKWKSLDWIGTILSLGMTVSLLLPLTWGGVERPWNDRTVIALFVTAGVLFIIFLFWEHRLGDRAMMPLSMFIRRTQLAAGIATFAMKATALMLNYYLPFFYQAKGRSAVKSGIDIIPMAIATPVGSIFSAWLSQVTGRYTPYLIAGPILYGTAAGLFFTVDRYTPNAALIGYQILIGIGGGIAFQMPLTAIQADYAYEPNLIPQASSLMTYLQLLGGVCGITIAGAIFGNQLSKDLAQYSDQIPQDVIKAVKESITYVFTDYPNIPGYSAQLRDVIIAAYIKAINYTFIMVMVSGGVTILASLFVKNWNLKERGQAATNRGTEKSITTEKVA